MHMKTVNPPTLLTPAAVSGDAEFRPTRCRAVSWRRAGCSCAAGRGRELGSTIGQIIADVRGREVQRWRLVRDVLRSEVAADKP